MIVNWCDVRPTEGTVLAANSGLPDPHGPLCPTGVLGALPPAVAGCHTRHGHVGAVSEEDQGGQQAGQGAEQAELDDARATQLELIHKKATQEGATAARWYHQVPCGRGRGSGRGSEVSLTHHVL